MYGLDAGFEFDSFCTVADILALILSCRDMVFQSGDLNLALSIFLLMEENRNLDVRSNCDWNSRNADGFGNFGEYDEKIIIVIFGIFLGS